MTLIRNHPEARWLPSRCHFALTALYAYARLVSGRAHDEVATAYAVDREQNALEHFAVSAMYFVVSACYIAALLDIWLPLAVACALGLILCPMVLQLPFFFVGLIVMPIWRLVTRQPEGSNVRYSSAATMALLFAISGWLATRSGWTRYVAVATLALFGINAIAALLVFALRRRIAAAEERCGV